jgi:hypothetical protein
LIQLLNNSTIVHTNDEGLLYVTITKETTPEIERSGVVTDRENIFNWLSANLFCMEMGFLYGEWGETTSRYISK